MNSNDLSSRNLVRTIVVAIVAQTPYLQCIIHTTPLEQDGLLLTENRSSKHVGRGSHREWSSLGIGSSSPICIFEKY